MNALTIDARRVQWLSLAASIGFLGIFFITQMFGLPIAKRAKWLLFALFILTNIAIYGFYYGTWASARR